MFRKRVTRDEVVRKYNFLRKEIGMYQMHIRNIVSSIDRKIEMFKNKAEYYKELREYAFASIYVKEISNLNVIKKVLNYVDMGLLAVNLRLDTMKIVLASLMDFREVARVVDDVIRDARAMSEAFDSYYKTFMDGYIDFETFVNIPEVNLAAFLDIEEEDAVKIIKLVERKVGEELSKKFPNIPRELDQILSDDPKEGVKRLYEMLATDGGYRESGISNQQGSVDVSKYGRRRVRSGIDRVSMLRVNPGRLKKLDIRTLDKFEMTILKYIVNVRKGSFTYMDIYRLAKIMKTSPQEILDGLYTLAEKRLISFQHGM
jgi:hypothetical protein